MPVRLNDLSKEQQAVLSLIATSPSGPDVGLNGQALEADQRDAWFELFKDGLADGILDDASNNWLTLTDRGLELWTTGTTS